MTWSRMMTEQSQYQPGRCQEARVWLEDYGWSRAPNFEAAMEKITEALGPP